MGSPETTEGGRCRRRCRQCCELMDVRARICPHCRTRTVKADLRGKLIRLGLILALALTSSLWLKPLMALGGWAGQVYYRHTIGPVLARHLSTTPAAGRRP